MFLFLIASGLSLIFGVLRVLNFAHGLILSDAAKIVWGTQQKSVSRPPELSGSFSLFGATIPQYNLFIILLGPSIALAFWFVLQRTRAGRFIRAAALDRETLGALG